MKAPLKFFRNAALALVASLTACGTAPTGAPADLDPQALLATWRFPSALPPSVGNPVADDEAAALLGFGVFFDARFSAGQSVRCASCHQPERVFGDGRPTSVGLAPVTRNSPSLYTAAWHRWQMWDGRADSLWSQPLLAFENEQEMNFSRLELAHRVKTSYRAEYEALFGPLPALGDAARFPAAGKPGDATWEAMSPADRWEVNLVAANVGKALEAYMRKLAHGRGRFDDFLEGNQGALFAEERHGLDVFLASGCASCHSGALLTDDDFHAVGLADDPGREAALELLAASPFTAAGEFHDGPPQALPAPTRPPLGAYRTPSLRNVARTGPWGHDGRFATLDALLDAHLAGGSEGPVDEALRPTTLSDAERAALLAFLRALDAKDPSMPWADWPDR